VAKLVVLIHNRSLLSLSLSSIKNMEERGRSKPCRFVSQHLKVQISTSPLFHVFYGGEGKGEEDNS
jgi:hypothetical protein